MSNESPEYFLVMERRQLEAAAQASMGVDASIKLSQVSR